MKGTLLAVVFLAGVIGIAGQLALRDGLATTAASPRPSLYCPEQITANGIIEGLRPEVSLRFEVAGRLARLPARENQEVARDDVLAELHNEPHKQQVAQASAQLAEAEADLEKLKNGERKEKRDAVRAQEEAKRTLYQSAKADFQRAEQLWASRAIGREQYDAEYFKTLRTEAEWKQAKAELALIEAPPRPEDVAAAQARVDGCQARLRLAQAELAKTRLLAPTGGRILQVFAEPGEMTGPAGSQPVIMLADLSKRRVRAFIEELDFARVHQGQKATVTVDALPEKEFVGRVAEVLSRMGKRAPHSDAPGEYRDVHFREVMIDLEQADELPTNLRVQVNIHAPTQKSTSAAD